MAARSRVTSLLPTRKSQKRAQEIRAAFEELARVAQKFSEAIDAELARFWFVQDGGDPEEIERIERAFEVV